MSYLLRVAENLGRVDKAETEPYPVGLLGFVPQPNLRLPTTKPVG
ncbi:hypothetical protein [Cylindrospermopsis raciborskii]|nr:hypothetical protein [Cylindrospermopsis raciborskii]EFA68050.1 hypothetical protein CRC_03410 [Cylindrospermopsis raciborskii CS-505]